MSVLSDRPDGFGFYYGFVSGDHRQINVRPGAYDMGLGAPRWRAYVGGKDIGSFTSKAKAEDAALCYLKANPPHDC